eukprot:321230_1
MFSSSSPSSDQNEPQTQGIDDVIQITDYKVGVWITKPIQRQSTSSVINLNYMFYPIADHHALIIYALSNKSNIIIEFSNNHIITIAENIDLSEWFIERKPKDLNHALKIITNALLMFNLPTKYHVFSNNCEHFVNLCYFGNQHSQQISQAKYSLVSGLGCGGIGMGSGLGIMYPHIKEAMFWQWCVDEITRQYRMGYGYCKDFSNEQYDRCIQGCSKWIVEAQKKYKLDKENDCNYCWVGIYWRYYWIYWLCQIQTKESQRKCL